MTNDQVFDRYLALWQSLPERERARHRNGDHAVQVIDFSETPLDVDGRPSALPPSHDEQLMLPYSTADLDAGRRTDRDDD